MKIRFLVLFLVFISSKTCLAQYFLASRLLPQEVVKAIKNDLESSKEFKAFNGIRRDPTLDSYRIVNFFPYNINDKQLEQSKTAIANALANQKNISLRNLQFKYIVLAEAVENLNMGYLVLQIENDEVKELFENIQEALAKVGVKIEVKPLIIVKEFPYGKVELWNAYRSLADALNATQEIRTIQNSFTIKNLFLYSNTPQTTQYWGSFKLKEQYTFGEKKEPAKPSDKELAERLSQLQYTLLQLNTALSAQKD